MFYARRNPDPAQKAQIFEIAKTIADIILKHLTVGDLGKPFHHVLVFRLKPAPDGNKLSLYTYQSLMLGLLIILIVDGT